MAKKDDPKKPSPDDFDKTVIDVDIRQLKEGFDETVIVRAPTAEDSDLHDIAFFDEERTGDHEVGEIPSGEALPEESTEPMPKKGRGTPPKEEARTRREEKVAKPEPPREKKAPKPELPPEAALEVPEIEEEAPPAPHAKPKFSPAYFGLALLFFLFLAEGLVEVLRQGAALRLPAIAAVGFALLCLAGALLRRWEGRTAFLGTVLAWFALVCYAGFRFYTSDPESLHFFKLPLDTWLGAFLIVASGVVAWILFTTKRVGFFPKLLASLACLVVVVAAVLAWIAGLKFEDGIWGPAALAKLPLLLRPGVLALGFAFPLAGLGALAALLFHPRAEGSLLRRGGWTLLGIAVLGTLLGVKLLDRQGLELPLLGRLAKQDFFGATLLDPATSPIRVQVFNVKPGFGKTGGMHLSVAASRSRAQGKGRQAFLMVRNQEGRSFAPGVPEHLALERGDKALKGVKASVETSRLGQERQIALLVNLPSLVETQVKSSLTGAILELARQLRGHDRLHVIGPAAAETLQAGEASAWPKQIVKALQAGAAGAGGDPMSQAFKKLSGAKGLKQVILVTDAAQLPTAEQRDAAAAEAKKQQAVFSILGLGAVESPGDSVYAAPTPASLGFELLSAAAESLGEVAVSFPQLAPLPRLKWAKDAEGKPVFQAGKLSFEVVAQDGGLIQSLQLKIDDEKPVDLEKSLLQQSVDLGALKVKPGAHRLTLMLATQEGDLVAETVEVQYVAKKPLRFVKPMDKDTVAGNFNVLLSVGRAQGVETQSVDLLVDGAKVGQSTSPPFQIPFNSASLPEGEHTLQAVQTYTDGTSESAQIQVNVNQQVPQVQILRPGIGEYLSNLAEIEAQVGGGLFEQVQKVEFLVDGEWIGESPQAPFRLLWSNSAFPAGAYFIQARAYLNSQATTTDAVQVQLGQGEIVVQADPGLSPTGMLFPDNVEVLLDASVGMKDAVGQALKIDLAKAAISGLVQALPQNVRLNARVLGASQLAGQGYCEDVKPLKNPSTELEVLQAQGTLPLARSLEMLEKDLKKAQGSRVGLLIANHWDQCGGDPIAVATRLAKQAERLRLHVIYFSDVDPTTESLLKRLAEVMGGRTFKVSRAEDLQVAIRDAVQVSFSLYDYKNTPVLETPLSQNPFAVRAGEYRLEIDTSPPIVKSNVLIPTGARKTFTVLHRDGKYELKDE
ncbi:MAG: hypothetical protein IT573_10310 [Deltaproteobacteria bacterium]|nr:hypothetical protein [Deltaproteobacteria bacterium]